MPAIARRGRATAASQLTSGFAFGFTDEANAVGDVLLVKVTGRDTLPMRDVYADREPAGGPRPELYRQATPGNSIAHQLAGGLAFGGTRALDRKALGGPLASLYTPAMIRTILVTLAALLAACRAQPRAPAAARADTVAARIDSALAAVELRLKDPESAQF